MPIPSIRDKLEFVVRIAAINLTSLLYAVAILQFPGLSSSVYKLAVFSCILIVLPVLSALVIRLCSRLSGEAGRLIDLSSKLVVLVCAVLLAIFSVLIWLFQVSLPLASLIIRWSLMALVCFHFVFLVAFFSASALTRSRMIAVTSSFLTGGDRYPVSLIFVLALSTAMLMIFYIGQGIPVWNVIVGWIDGLAPKPSWTTLLLAFLCAFGVLFVCFRLLGREDTYQASELHSAPFVFYAALILAVAAVGYFYFDFKFDTDVLHFLTNVGPASQMVFADSVPMVTAFSQYGPGPLTLTGLIFLKWPPSFHAANIMAQLHSIAFYSVILMCLCRMTVYRMSALWLGFFAIGVLLAGWWGGNGSLNSVPSSMGMRYLPNAILVLAISYLPEGRTLSLSVILAVLLSALWSFETLGGSVAILGIFILICAVRKRDIVGLLRSLFVGIIFPVAVALMLTSCFSMIWAGRWPDYLAYMQFALIYNMTSEFWSLDASGTFLGWIPVALAIMIVLTLAWLSAIESDARHSVFSSHLLIYRFAPMAALTGFMSSYFAGRSVDFTLIISFLPLCAIVIPAILAILRDSLSNKTISLQFAALPVFIVFFALFFSFSALYRKGSPYSTAISECLYNSNCTPSQLLSAAAQRYELRPMLDQAANRAYFDTSGLAEEAITLIQRYAPQRPRIPLFLGIHPSTIWSVHTNAVLVLTGKGHRWPISYVLSDELNSRLKQKILGADVHLEEGEIVFIRSDETRLGQLEAAIVAKIRKGALLCQLTHGGLVSVYRATFNQRCEQGT